MLPSNKFSNNAGSHYISIAKCNNYNIVNTTWKPFYAYIIDNYSPGTEAYYYIDDNLVLSETTDKQVIEKK
jgi:hypothetical protein